MIVDASVILCAFFPDESQAQAQWLIRDHVAGRVVLQAPTLLPYELCNAVWQARRRGRIRDDQLDEILQAIEDLDIHIQHIGWTDVMSYARQFDRTAYDAAYLALAHTSQQALVTGDLRLYNAVSGQLDWVQWIGDYHDDG